MIVNRRRQSPQHESPLKTLASTSLQKAKVKSVHRHHAAISCTHMRIVLILLLLSTSASVAQNTEPDNLLKAAIQAQQHGDYKTAILDYQQVLKLRPDMAEVRANLGTALSHEGRYQEAITEDRLALAASPGNLEIKMNLGLAYFKKGDMPKAEEIFKQVQQSMPDNPKIAILLGDSEVRSGQAAAAVTMLTPLEAGNSENQDFEFVLGTALIHSGHLRDGVARIQKVAEATGAADTYLLAGSTLLDLHDFAHAKTDLEEALRLNPNLPRVHALTGIARDMTGDAMSAVPEFQEELKHNPDDFDSNLYLGAILYKQRHMAEAKPFLDKALQLKPYSQLALYESALWDSTSGQYEDAAKYLEAVEKANPSWLDPHVELAKVYYRLHRPADGAKERAIVAKLNAQQQSEGPPQP
ncbi:MAG: tetratricopeptide repeat protein [Acidobacteriaceae bacterium]